MESSNLITIPNVIFIVIWIIALIAWCYGAFYSFEIRKEYNPERRWGKRVFGQLIKMVT